MRACAGRGAGAEHGQSPGHDAHQRQEREPDRGTAQRRQGHVRHDRRLADLRARRTHPHAGARDHGRCLARAHALGRVAAHVAQALVRRVRLGPIARRRALLGVLGGRQQRLPHLEAGLEPPLGVLLQRLHHDLFDRGRHRRRARAQGRRRVVGVGHQIFDGDVRVERRAAAQDLVHQHAQRVDVRAPVQVLVARLLGRQVRRSAADHARLRDPRAALARAGQPEVQDLGVVADGPGRLDHEDVLGLQIAVDQVQLVRVVQRLADLGHDSAGPRRIQRTLLVDDVGQVSSLEQFHDEVELVALGPSEVEHRDDVRVRHPAGGLRLLHEPLDDDLVVGVAGTQELDRDFAVHRVLQRAVHAAHAALAEDGRQRVLAVDDTSDAGFPAPARIHRERVVTQCVPSKVSQVVNRDRPRGSKGETTGRWCEVSESTADPRDGGLRGAPCRRDGPGRPRGSVAPGLRPDGAPR